jgi:SAM-dependent methyltransferase
VATTRVPDTYFDRLYAESADPWRLADSWYERRKYAITLAMLPYRRYRHAFEPGCSVGVLTELLTHRCDRVTATDVAVAALTATDERLQHAGRREQVVLLHGSVDQPWPPGGFDLVVLSDVAYYLPDSVLRTVLDRECRRLAPHATVVAAHWRHRIPENPITGDHANDVIATTSELHVRASYRDPDLAIEVFGT